MPNARNCIAWYAEAIDKVYGQIAPTGADALALVGREPLGVVGAVIPWNYPLIVTAWKLAPSLATGNSVVLKPAEQSPLTALALAELGAEAGLPDGVLNDVPGFGEEAGEPLGRHLLVDKITFTGAGGCRGPGPNRRRDRSRVVVERALVGPLAERLVSFARGMAPGDPADPSTTLGALVSDEHLDGVLERVERAAGDGARLLAGGGRAQPVPGGAYMEPTVLEALDPADPIVQEEVFGPVLAIQQADDAEHAVALANGTGYGLAAAGWSSNITTAHRVARRLRAGTVWINTFDASSLATPFGGVKDSGHGRDRSLHALDAYTHLKTTWVAL